MTRTHVQVSARVSASQAGHSHLKPKHMTALCQFITVPLRRETVVNSYHYPGNPDTAFLELDVAERVQ
jgi:hypothetical protein